MLIESKGGIIFDHINPETENNYCLEVILSTDFAYLILQTGKIFDIWANIFQVYQNLQVVSLISLTAVFTGCYLLSSQLFHIYLSCSFFMSWGISKAG